LHRATSREEAGYMRGGSLTRKRPIPGPAQVRRAAGAGSSCSGWGRIRVRSAAATEARRGPCFFGNYATTRSKVKEPE
jgi:hypothetical protein